jgi:DNA polymerase-3 subunit gamma/tau
MLTLLQQIALYQGNPALAAVDDFDVELLQRYGEAWSPEEVQLYYQIMLQGRHDLLISPDEAAGFEMLMLRLIAFSPATDDVVETGELKKKPELKPAPETTADKRPEAEVGDAPVIEPEADAVAAAPAAEETRPDSDPETKSGFPQSENPAPAEFDVRLADAGREPAANDGRGRSRAPGLHPGSRAPAPCTRCPG